MTTQDYHKEIMQVLKDFSEEVKEKLEREEKSFKLTSNKRHSQSLVEYCPDFCFKHNIKKRIYEHIVIEILDSQSYEGIFADIIECACIDSCRVLIFISKEEEKQILAKEIADIVNSLLRDLNNKDDVLDIVSLHAPYGSLTEVLKDDLHKEINKIIKLPRSPFKLGKSRFGGRAVLG